jgi:hypothetical protein
MKNIFKKLRRSITFPGTFLQRRCVPIQTKGSAMVSSAIYFPIIILATLFAIHIMLNQYEEVKQTSAMHMELRAQASAETETGLLIENKAGNDRDKQASQTVKKEKASYGKIYGDEYIQFKGKQKYSGGRLTGYSTETAEYSARSYLIDEQSEVRNPLW